jgi:adenylate cyclase
MAKVKVVINGVEGEVDEGITLLEAAKQIHAGLAHLCFGNAICSTCRIEVLKGMDSLSDKEMKEKVSLNYHLSFADEVRLGCQARVKGPGPVIVKSPLPFSLLS